MESNITFVIFTKNEESRIRFPVKNFLPYGPVLVFDNYSTDKTRQIVRKLGAKPILIRYGKSHPGFQESKKVVDFVFSFVKTDWVFWGYADDMVPETCLDLYKKISQENKYKIIIQKRKTMLYDGKTEYHPGLISVKFFRKDSLDFDDNTIHQMGKPASHVKPEEILYLPQIDEYATYHFSRETFTTFVAKIDAYTTIETRQQKKKINSILLLMKPLFTFFENYILYGTWRYGAKGFIASVGFAIYTFTAVAKKYEIDHGLNFDSIEKSFSKQKQWLLSHSPTSGFFKKIRAKIMLFFLSRLHRWYKAKQV